MIRVQDVNNSIYQGLRSLGKRRYLCAMWNVCAELQALYQERMGAEENGLVVSTLRLLRNVVLQDGDTHNVAQDASNLYANWERIRSERKSEVKSGHANARMVFREIAGEIAGVSRLYDATEFLDLAAGDRWREDRRGPLWDDPNEEVGDDTPMAQTLSFLERTVAGVAELSDAWLSARNWDPEFVQSEVTGRPPVLP